MKFAIISIEINELYGDSAWSSHYSVDLNLINGKILFKDKFIYNKNFEYEVEIKYYEEITGYQIKIDYLNQKEGDLYLPTNLLNFFKINLLKNKIENKLVEKNYKDKKTKI